MHFYRRLIGFAHLGSAGESSLISSCFLIVSVLAECSSDHLLLVFSIFPSFLVVLSLSVIDDL